MDRCLAYLQECSILGACWLLHAYRPLTCKNCLEIFSYNSKILDVLFDCAIIPRRTVFPTITACVLACEMLTLLFLWLSHIVQGVSTVMDTTLNKQDLKSLLQCLTILRSREDWTEKIIDTWMKVEEEDYLGIRTSVHFGLVFYDFF